MEKAAKKLLDRDYLFLAAGTMRARLLIDAIVHQYLIPAVQIGSKVSRDRMDAGDGTAVLVMDNR
jgi:hypothetical protein